MRRQRGISLLEVAIVIAILGIVAAVALPNFASTDPQKVELAAAEVADAIRFARSEAIRTSIPHGVYTNSFGEQVRVYSLPGLFPVYDVRHPVDKKLYNIRFNTSSNMANVDLVAAVFDFDGTMSSSTYLGFNTHGIPKTTFFGTDYMLTNGTITLSHGDHQRIISIAPMTGRVTIQ